MTPPPVTPSFIMVGCQRCGTTWVDAALREHPRVHLPAKKQTYFFDRHFDRGIEWYLEQFADAPASAAAIGEVATGYCLPHAVERMARHLPDVRIVMAMRHPVERAYSNFRTRRAEEGWRSFEHALAASPDLRDRGRYIEQIDALAEHYDRDRMLLLLYEDLAADDRAYLRSILSFLGVGPDFESSQFGRQKNASALPRVRRVLHRLGLKPVLRLVSRSAVGDAVRRARKRSGRRSAAAMDPSTRADLVRYFKPYNDRLSAILDRDLSAWNA